MRLSEDENGEMVETTDICPVCGSEPSSAVSILGFTFKAMCGDCEAKQRELEEEKAEATVKADAADMILEEIPRRYRENDCSRFPAEWSDIIKWRPNDEGRGLVVVGDTGKCKTRMLCQLAINLAHIGVKFSFMRSSTLAALVRQQYSDFEPWAARDEIKRLSRVPVLIVDDLGKQASSPAVEEAFFDLIEERTSQGLPVLVTANAKGAELERMMSADRGRPLIRRIRDYCTAVVLK